MTFISETIKEMEMSEIKKNLSNRVGILGGGQLSLMLADAAVPMGIKPIVLAENQEAPAARVHAEAMVGSIEDEKVLDQFFSQVSRVIFENEFVNCEKLKKVAEKWGVEFFPSLDVMAQLQDKLYQKEWLKKLQIPTAEFTVLDSKEISINQISEILKKWGGACVLKWAKMGYDGKGVMEVTTQGPDFSEIKNFYNEAQKRGSRVYAERRIDFKRELAVVAVYSVRNEFIAYPLVISEQSEGICRRVYGPAVSLGVNAKLEAQAHHYAKSIAESLNLTGVFALEFFETENKELWVNEIAPRVHNSGHYTQDACFTDQFQNHIRAVLGAPLGKVGHTPGFAMLNIIGQDLPSKAKEILMVAPQSGQCTQVHWYGKQGCRARRKLGHLNGVVDSIQEMDELLAELEQCYTEWLNRLLN